MEIAVRADFVTVLARTGEDAHGGLTFFVVERGAKGFTVGAKEDKLGMRASDTVSLTFDETPVKKAAVKKATVKKPAAKKPAAKKATTRKK